MNNKQSPETIEVQRRRQGASSGPEGRAEAPERQRPGGTGGGIQPPSSGGGPRSSGGNLFGKLPAWAVIILLVIVVVIKLCSGGLPSLDTGSDGNSAVQEPLITEPANIELPTAIPTKKVATAVKKTVAAPSGQGQKWLVMIYQDADDQILEQDIFTDFNEAERVGSTDRVSIVAQMDRYRGAFTGDGNWTSARRYYLTQDDDLNSINSEMVQDLGEVNMADGNTLIDFVTWAVQAYPADRYALILSDHGAGWPGGWSDDNPGGKDSSRAPIASALGDQIFLMELDQSLSTIRQQTGIDKFELIGMDACLMGDLEVLSALEPHAKYAVVSQETEPALGWAYTSFLESLTSNPDMSSAELSTQIVSSYIEGDQRIVDDRARAEFLRQGSPMGGLFGEVSAAQLTQQLERDVTLTAVDLSALPTLMSRVNDLAYAMQQIDQSAVASARTYAQSYTSIFGHEVPPSYLDLGSFVKLLSKKAGSSKITQASQAVLDAIQQAVIAEKHGRGKPGSMGISIYFPNSTLYNTPVAGAQSYTAVAKRFTQASLWDDFLAFHYIDRPFEPQASESVVPSSGTAVRAPGAGQITISPITLSSTSAAPGQPVRLSTTIDGQNIGYIYLFVGFYDQASNSIFVADTDYLQSPNTLEQDGIYYPQWSDSGSFNMQFSWEPTVFAISDGQKSVVALMTPQTYGASAEDAVYTVDGIYTYAASGETRTARLYFQNGKLQQVFGFTDTGETGSAREITPQTGDTFTVLEKWLDLDASGQVTQTSSQEGDTLTFGDQMFTWKEMYAAAGDYLVGFLVSDLDGNTYPMYTRVTVR